MLTKKIALPKKIWKKELFKVVIGITLIVGIVLGAFYSFQLLLNTHYPFLTVESGSMCIPHDGNCDGWSHPFDNTLHVGDILIIQGIKPEELNTHYPNSDIIVYKDPKNNNLIVHRIISKQTINGTTYFKTKGDANGPILWPNNPFYFDDIPDPRGVPQELVVGKVLLRIPWFGNITLFIKNNPYGLPTIATLIFLLAFVEFILPLKKRKKKPQTTN
ncbi:MAG: signal peptidase I [Candidatus Bathyarchaeota archaeon]|nr:signal peptidase I [Candidatus Bathyarchaeota archaeon]